jgi:hypothetical protein
MMRYCEYEARSGQLQWSEAGEVFCGRLLGVRLRQVRITQSICKCELLVKRVYWID